MSTEKLKTDLIITSIQCKAARNLLEWKQEDLSKNSGIGMSTIANFERKKINPISRTLKELKATFEEAGIEFENSEEGIGLRLSKKNEDS